MSSGQHEQSEIRTEGGSIAALRCKFDQTYREHRANRILSGPTGRQEAAIRSKGPMRKTVGTANSAKHVLCTRTKAYPRPYLLETTMGTPTSRIPTDDGHLHYRLHGKLALPG